MIDHDRLFKELLKTFFADFVDLFLPEVSAYLDRKTITFLDKEVFANLLTGRKHEADLVAKAKFRGRDSFFLVHLEHQGQPQAAFAHRMFNYFAPLHLNSGLPVYPIALFSHGSTAPEPDNYQVQFPDLEVLRFRFRVIQLSRLNWRDFMRQPNPVASALMARMGMAESERPRVKLECLRLLVTLHLDPARMRLISGFVDSYLRLTAKEELLFEKQADTLLGRTEQKKVMELTTSWKEEGRQEGCLHTVVRQLKRRLGRLAPSLESRVRALSLKEMEDLAEALLDFTDRKDLEKWLAIH